MKRYKMVVMVLVTYVLFLFPVLASDIEEPLLKAFKDQFNREYLQLGLVMQFVYDYQNERIIDGRNGFNIANMRLKIMGQLDNGFSYFFQTNFIGNKSILDAYMNYHMNNALNLQIGQFKVPFSAEYLIAAPDIDFVNRSRVVSALAPGRDIGIQLGGTLVEDQIKYSAGVFNGNGFGPNGNDDGNSLYAARITFSPSFLNNKTLMSFFEMALNTAYSQDFDVKLGSGLNDNFRGDRWLYGADLRMNLANLLISGEYINAELKVDNAPDSNPSGYHLTAGYMVHSNTQILIRWDKLNTDNLQPGKSGSDWLLVGINFWPTNAAELQLNYIFDREHTNFKNHQILFNSQIVL